MTQRPATPDWKRTVALWSSLLGIVLLANYFASVGTGASFWEAIPWWTLGVVGVAIVFITWVVRRPVSPEVEEAIRQLVTNRATCSRCGAPRGPTDIFCGRCHKRWELMIVAVVAVGL
ncbi:MAG TPA: hypothetical protein VFI89_08770, partial [Burkholderiales bacterium]|nr:hypothetical protein [Burkholderiales bacterium]